MAYKELVDYIQDAKKKGFSDDQIKSKLLGTGWIPSAIDEAFLEADRLSQPSKLKSDVLEPISNPVQSEPVVSQVQDGTRQVRVSPRISVPVQATGLNKVSTGLKQGMDVVKNKTDVFPSHIKGAAEELHAAQEAIADSGERIAQNPILTKKPEQAMAPILSQVVPENPPPASLAKPALHTVQGARSVFAENIAPAKGGKSLGKKSFWIVGVVLLLLILLAAGAYAAAYYGYVKLPFLKPSPEVVWQRFSNAKSSADNITADVKLKFLYEDKLEKLNPGISQYFDPGSKIENIAAELVLDGTLTILGQDSIEADIKTSVGVENAGAKISFALPLVIKDDYIYLNLDESGFLKEVFVDKGINSGWVKIKLDSNSLDTLEQDVQEFSETDVEVENIFKKIDLNKVEQFRKENPVLDSPVFAYDEVDGSDLLYTYELVYNRENLKNYIGLYIDELGKLDEFKAQPEVVASMKSFIVDIVDRTSISPITITLDAYGYELRRLKLDGNVLSIISVANAVYEVLESFTDAGFAESKKISDMQQVAYALEIYHQQRGGYPEGKDGQAQGLAPEFLPSWPVAPTASGECSDWDNTYWYEHEGDQVTSGEDNSLAFSDYVITFCLEKPAAGFLAGKGQVTPGGGVVVNGEPACLDVSCGADFTGSFIDAFESLYRGFEYNARFNFELSFSNFRSERQVNAPSQARDVTGILEQEDEDLGEQTSMEQSSGSAAQVLTYVENVRQGLELYKTEQGEYPSSLLELDPQFTSGGSGLATGGVCSATAGYEQGGVVYSRTSLESYTLEFCLPVEVENYAAGLHTASELGIK